MISEFEYHVAYLLDKYFREYPEKNWNLKRFRFRKKRKKRDDWNQRIDNLEGKSWKIFQFPHL